MSCSKPKKCHHDVIVVGVGTAGAPLAKLASDPVDGEYVIDVLGLEAGFNYNNDFFVLNYQNPPGSVNAAILALPPYSFVHNSTVNVANTTSITSQYVQPNITAGNGSPPGQTNLNTVFIQGTVTGGIALGGTSIHNNEQFFRGTPKVWNDLAAKAGDDRWSYDKMLPIFKSIETFTPNGIVPNKEQRGESGPSSCLQITPPDLIRLSPLLNNLATNSANGIGVLNDLNDPTQGTVGFSTPQRFTTPFPWRRSFSGKDWLEPVMDIYGKGLNGRKLQVKFGTYVNRVIFENLKAVGVEYYYSNNPSVMFTAYAKKIVLCAGAFHTPGILERSGYGDASILTPLNIPVVFNNSNVGKNLLSQYGCKQPAITDPTGYPAPPFNASALPPPHPPSTTYTLAVPEGQFYLPAPAGNALVALHDLRGVSVNSYTYPADGVRRFNMFMYNSSTNTTPYPGGTNGELYMGNYNTSPKSSGTVHITSTNPTVQPAINLSIFTDYPYSSNNYPPESDASRAIAFLKLLKQWAVQNGKIMLMPPESVYAPSSGSVEDSLYAWLTGNANVTGPPTLTSNNYTIQSHYYGTTSMGKSIGDGAVVNGKLEVLEVENLMIADLGVESVIIDGNPAQSAIAIGVQAALILRKKLLKNNCQKHKHQKCKYKIEVC